MSLILEFTVDSDQFTLGTVLAGIPGIEIELERIVPTGDTVMPFLWVTSDDFEAFEQQVTAHEAIDELVALDRVEDSTLYRLVWHAREDDLIEGITAADGAILEAYGGEHWEFHLRLPDHDRLSAFYNYCTEEGIKIHIDRTYTFTERTASGRQYGLSQEQREALILGLRSGYFDTPSRTSLEAMAEEFGISQQAMSNRVRRGTKKVLSEALLDSASTFE